MTHATRTADQLACSATTAERALIYCIVCGTPWEDHTADCPRHGYRPVTRPAPEVRSAVGAAPGPSRAILGDFGGGVARRRVAKAKKGVV